MTMEDITGWKKRWFLTSITICKGEISTILLDEKNWSLLVGDNKGRLLQMSFYFQVNLWKILKDYGDLGIGCIYSSCCQGDIAIFGGNNRKLAFINTRKREFMGYSFYLAPKFIYCIELCWIQKKSQPKALLMISGSRYNYNGKIDELDVTQLFPKKMRSKNNQNVLESYQGNSENDIILYNQFPVNSIQLYPKKLKKIKKDLS